MEDNYKYRLSNGKAEMIQNIIDSLPYPVAIFDRNLTVSIINKAFRNAANICMDPLSGSVRINRGRIDDPQLAASIMKVFRGDTVFSEAVKTPFSMFSGFEQKEVLPKDCVWRVEVSPVPAENKKITHGIIVILQMKQYDR